MMFGPWGERSEKESGSDDLVNFWTRAFEAEWDEAGVPTHHAKSLDNGNNGGFQGAMIHDQEHWLGTSVRRRWLHLHATISVLGSRRVHPTNLQRLIGKASYITGFRSCIRSLFQDCYVELERRRGAILTFELPCEVWGELAMFGILMPLCVSHLDSD